MGQPGAVESAGMPAHHCGRSGPKKTPRRRGVEGVGVGAAKNGVFARIRHQEATGVPPEGRVIFLLRIKGALNELEWTLGGQLGAVGVRSVEILVFVVGFGLSVALQAALDGVKER